MSEIDILPSETPEPLGDEEYLAIARLKTSQGGQSLMLVCEQNIRGIMWQLVKTNPNDVGAVAQLQAQIGCYFGIRNLLLTDEENYRHVMNEEK